VSERSALITATSCGAILARRSIQEPTPKFAGAASSAGMTKPILKPFPISFLGGEGSDSANRN
jgi:hypothetical protein